MGLTQEKMWDRMMASDASYDGRFFTGVHSTGIYCLPSCHARKPKRQNVQFYRTAERAEAAGLRPCKKCKPDEFAKGIDTDRDRLMGVVDSLRREPKKFASVEDIAYEAAMSPSSLFSAFRTHYHQSPGAILGAARVRKAAVLLRDRAITAAEAGMEAGFDSTSAFYDNFRRAMGMPPAQYQRLRGVSDFTLELPEDFRPEYVLALLSRDQESRTERVNGQSFALGIWADRRAVAVEARFDDRRLHVCVDGPANTYDIHRQLTRLLGLEQDPGGFEEHVRGLGLGSLIAGQEGLRIPQSLTHFDALVWSIVGQQVGLGFAAALRRRISDVAGESINSVLSAPPTPERVADMLVDELLPHQYSRRKAEYLIGAAQLVASGTLNFEDLAEMPPAQAEARLVEVRGIGPWSANYLMMRSFGFPDCVPIGDTGLTSGLARCFDVPRPDAEETVALMARFRPYRSFATYHVWRSLAKATDG